MQLTVLWLIILSFLVHSNSFVSLSDATVAFTQPLASIINGGSHSPDTPGPQDSQVPSTVANLNEQAVSPADHHTRRSLDQSNHHAAHLILHKSRRDGRASVQKCTEAPMARNVGYYQVSNLRERRCNRVSPAQINTNRLTHLYLSHVDMSRDNFSVVPAHPSDVSYYKELTTLKTSSMQTWLAVGGREFNSDTWRLMTARNDRRRMFITSFADFMSRYGFQGVDLDWQFPSSPDDAANFVALVHEMRKSWANRYGISVTLPPSPQYLRGFDPKAMEPHIDFFNYMSWDIQGLPDLTIRAHTDLTVIQNETTALWAAHLDPHKINFGLANYGHGYTLRDINCRTPGCPFTGLSKPGPCTNAIGFMSETEIEALIKEKSLKPFPSNLMTKQITWDDQWIGYDDDDTRAQKTAWAAQKCFGGTARWSVDMASGEGSGSNPGGVGIGVPSGPGSPSGWPKSTNQPARSTAGHGPDTLESSTSTSQSNSASQSNAPSSGTAASTQRTLTVVSLPAGSNVLPTKSGIMSSPKGSTQTGQPSSSVIVTSIQGILRTMTVVAGSSTSGASSGASSTTIKASAAAQTTIPSPTIAPGSMVTEGATAVLGLVPLAIAAQKGIDKAQKAITPLSQANSPNADDVNFVLGVLASAYTTLTFLEKEVGMINTNSLSEDIRKIIDSIKKALPSITKGTSDTIDDLKNSIKDPKNINKDDIHKADQLLGKQGSVTGHITQALKPLTDWKPPKGNDDIILGGILTLPSPSVGDDWKGTTIPGTLTVPSPTLNWDHNIMDDHGGSSNPGNGGGNSDGNGGGGGGGGEGGGGGGGFFSGLINLAKQAEGAVNGAANTLTHLSGLSDISVSDVSGVISQLTSAAQDVGGLGVGLEGIELDTFAPADISRIVEVQNVNRALYKDIRSTLNNLVQFINKPPQALQLIKMEAPKWVIGGTILGLMGKSGSSSINSFPRTKVTSTSPQPAAPTESGKAVKEYFLVTVPDTNVKVFQAWIKGLPDKGAGVQQHYDWPRVYQTYKTKMTQQEAEIVNMDPIVGHIGANFIRTVDFDHINTGTKEQSSPRSQRESKGIRLKDRSLPNIRVVQKPASRIHLRMLSALPKSELGLLDHTLEDPWFDYLYEQTAGLGANVYVYDSGFRLTHREFAAPHPAPEFAPVRGVVPMADGAGHGDRVATLAVGRVIGVASQANLVAVKSSINYIVDEVTGQPIQGAYLDEIYENWWWIINDVRTRNPSRMGKAVLSWSKGNFYPNMFSNVQHIDYVRWGIVQPEFHDLFLPLLVDAWSADIVTVFAAGNDDAFKDPYIGSVSPQRFANSHNPMIIVGSVNHMGRASDFNKLVGPALFAHGRDLLLTGKLTTYAMGENVDTIVPDEYFDYDHSNGTSFAAPQIAGLAAYFLTLPTLHWEPYRVAQDMKNFIQRLNRMPPRSPDGVFVAHNGVHELLLFCPPPGPSVRAKPRSIFHHIANIFRRQKEEKEVVIFENGKLTDPKYSDQLQCQSTSSTKSSSSTNPSSSSSSKSSTSSKSSASSQTSAKSSRTMQSGSPSRVTEHEPPIVQSISSTPTPSPTRLPVIRWSCYQSGDKENPFLAPFRREAMSTHINNTCHDFPTWAGGNHTRIADGDNTILLHLFTTAPKNDIPFLESDCLKGYDTIILDRCRTETDQSWGGTVEIGNVRFDAYARKLPPVTDYTCFTTLKKTPKLAEHGGGLAFNRQDMRDFIEKTCSDNAGAGSKGWKFNTSYISTDKPYLTIRSGKYPGNRQHRHQEFDKDICFRGFNAVMEMCPTLKGDPDETQTYGGQCTIDDIKYTIFNKKTT